MPYVVERWPGGMLTNFPTIRKAVKKMGSIDRMIKDGRFDTLSKREKLQVTRQRAKLEKNLGSIQDLTRLPAAIFVIDVMKEQIAVREANKLDIPVFAIVDTNSDPRDIDFVIPANDDSSKSIELIMNFITDSIREGLEERKVERADASAQAEQQEQEKEASGRRERKSRVSRRERVKKEDKVAEDAPLTEKPAKETKAVEKPAKETKVVEKPAKETKAAEKPSKEAKSVDKPAEEAKSVDKPAEDKKAEE